MPLNQPAPALTDSGTVDGYIATASGHVVGGRDDPAFKYSWNDWFVDIGVSSRAEAEALGIHAGCRVIWHNEVRRLGAHHLVRKAMDGTGPRLPSPPAREKSWRSAMILPTRYGLHRQFRKRTD